MTTRPAPHHTVGGWAFTLENLHSVNAQPDPEQEKLLDPMADGTPVVCLLPLPDPYDVERLTDWLRPRRARVHLHPRDAAPQPVPVLVPGLLTHHAQEVATSNSLAGPAARRFPSVHVKLGWGIYEPGDLLYSSRGHQLPLWPSLVRVWNAWPISDPEYAGFALALERVLGLSGYLDALIACKVALGVLDACDAVSMLSTIDNHPTDHVHIRDPIGPARLICQTGEDAIADVLNVLHWPGTTKLKPLRMDWQLDEAPNRDLGRIAEQLGMASSRATHAVLDLVPHWRRSELARMEEEFNPWP